MPLIRIVHDRKFHNRRAMERGFLVRFDSLIVSEVIPVELELRTVRGSHPLVVEINDVAVGTIVDDQRNDVALAVLELLRELQDVSDCCATETVQALVIIADHADILAVSGKEEHKLLLDEVRVLVLVNHDVRYLGAHLAQNLRIVTEEIIGFNLDR